MIGQDREYWEKYLGRQLEDFQKELDTPFYDGSTFPLSSYRGKYWYYNSQRSPQSRYLFFDGDQKAWGWCVIVVDGRISGYGLAKD